VPKVELMNESIDIIANEQEALTKVTKAFEASKRDQQEAFTLFRDLYRLFRFYKAQGSSVKIFDPVGFTIVVGLLSKMFVKPPQVLVAAKLQKFPQARTPEEMVLQYRMKQKTEEAVNKVKSLLEMQMDNPTLDEPMDEEFISFITEMLICGTAVAKVHWDYTFITQFEEVPAQDEFGQPMLDEQGQPAIQRQRVDKMGFDDPVFECIPIENFYIQPGAKNISKSRYAIYEKFEDLESYIERAEKEGNRTNLDKIVAGTYQKGDRTGITNARGIRGKGSSNEKYKDKIHILEYWEDDLLIEVINESVVTRNEDNPDNHGRKPFVSMQYQKNPHNFYGIGALEPIQDLHKAVNISLTQRLEYVSNLLNQQFMVVNQRDFDEDALLEQYPIVHTNSADAVVPLQKSTVGQEVFVSGNELVAEIEKISAYSGYSNGTPASAQDKTSGTATGISIIVQEAQTRFDLTLKRFEKIVLRFTAQMFLALDRQYLSSTEGKLIKLSGGSGVQFDEFVKNILDEYEWHIEIVPGSVGFIDKQQKVNNLRMWKESAMMMPHFDLEKYIEEEAGYLDIDDPQRFFKTGPDGRPVLNILAMAKQSEAQGAQADRENNARNMQESNQIKREGQNAKTK